MSMCEGDMKKVSPGQEAKTLSCLNYLRDDTVNSGGRGVGTWQGIKILSLAVLFNPGHFPGHIPSSKMDPKLCLSPPAPSGQEATLHLAQEQSPPPQAACGTLCALGFCQSSSSTHERQVHALPGVGPAIAQELAHAPCWTHWNCYRTGSGQTHIQRPTPTMALCTCHSLWCPSLSCRLVVLCFFKFNSFLHLLLQFSLNLWRCCLSFPTAEIQSTPLKAPTEQSATAQLHPITPAQAVGEPWLSWFPAQCWTCPTCLSDVLWTSTPTSVSRLSLQFGVVLW